MRAEARWQTIDHHPLCWHHANNTHRHKITQQLNEHTHDVRRARKYCTTTQLYTYCFSGKPQHNYWTHMREIFVVSRYVPRTRRPILNMRWRKLSENALNLDFEPCSRRAIWVWLHCVESTSDCEPTIRYIVTRRFTTWCIITGLFQCDWVSVVFRVYGAGPWSTTIWIYARMCVVVWLCVSLRSATVCWLIDKSCRLFPLSHSLSPSVLTSNQDDIFGMQIVTHFTKIVEPKFRNEKQVRTRDFVEPHVAAVQIELVGGECGVLCAHKSAENTISHTVERTAHICTSNMYAKIVSYAILCDRVCSACVRSPRTSFSFVVYYRVIWRILSDAMRCDIHWWDFRQQNRRAREKDLRRIECRPSMVNNSRNSELGF